MGAYQPIQMALPRSGADTLGDALSELGRVRRQDATQAAERKRQDFADFQSSYLQAQKLADKGDHAGAAAMMARWKGRYGESPSALATPAAPAAAPGGAPQGGSPMPDSLEFQHQQMPQEEGPDGVGPDGRPVQPPIDPGFVDSLPMGAPPPPQAPPTAGQALMGAAPGARPPPPADHPLVAANEASKAKDQQRGHGVLYFTPPGGGQEMSYDSQAVREQQQQQRMAEMDAAIKDAPPAVQAMYQKLRPSLALGGQIDPGDIVKMAAHEDTGARADAQQRYRQQHEQDVMAQRERLRGIANETQKRGQNMALQGNLAKAAAMGPGNPLKVDTNARADVESLRHAMDDAFRQGSAKTLLSSDRTMRAVITNAAAEGPSAVMAHKDAFMGLERVFRGAVPTEAEQQLLLRHMGGIEGALEQYFEDVRSGDFSDTTLRNLTVASKLAKKEQDENVTRYFGGLADKFGQGSSWSAMGPSVNAEIRGQARQYGLEMPELYPDAGQNQSVVGASRIAQQAAKPPQKKPQKTPAGPAAPKAAIKAKSDEDYWKEAQ